MILHSSQSHDSDGPRALPDETTDGKRGITYQILKNKGLTPHRKKDEKNPRVKLRNKFDKALKKRKSVVRDVVSQDKPFVGEETGIRAGIVRSRKL